MLGERQKLIPLIRRSLLLLQQYGGIEACGFDITQIFRDILKRVVVDIGSAVASRLLKWPEDGFVMVSNGGS